MAILTLCGSLRAQSSNREILRAYERLGTLSFIHYEAIAELPHFNPDIDCDPLPAPVAALRRAVAAADALVISTPEYAHALPGAFKNLLDWLVSDPAVYGKPVAILHADRGSRWALDSLAEVLRTMSADVVDGAITLLPLPSNRIDAAAILAHDDLRSRLQSSLDALVHRLGMPQAG